MRKLLLLVTLFVLAALGWGAYWFFGASALENELSDWFEKRRARGWVAEAATLETRGFPNRFDTTFEALELADPDTRVAWSAPSFQLLSLSYKPNHLIAVWPGTQRFGLPGQEIDVSSERMLGSFEVDPDPALPLRAVTIEAESARFVSSLGWETGLGYGQLSMRRSPDAEVANSYDLYFDASELTPSADLLAKLAGAAALPEVIGHARVEASVVFDKRWDKSAIEEARPQPRQIALDGFSLHWGELRLEAMGRLEVSAEGVPTGDIDVTATNWRALVAVLEASGKIDSEYVGALEKGLELVAALKGNPETLDVGLTFKRGWMNIGPVPTMPAPKIALP